MENEQQIPWEKIPEGIKRISQAWYPLGSKILNNVTTDDMRLSFANYIMSAMKAEQERAFRKGVHEGNCQGRYPEDDPDFEIWYQNTYLK